ncbi:mucosa-associated lymphoid tissue lymphoma translocation protein 1-like isoform X2 [Belonocnema kinseyi]|uniref:mucosa-associated lymphoid tissue lymphoma translocation protein 1-like isoform X2 n=1 Tax=Belonocnema kinseyi TaxID=2817044 RepID=UPI00143E0958|nr:mucosa-associated lymphoid tissue lymphoma translocation protein 1-like isoform X2 [Belonocnema kinseyi]
MNLIKIQVGVVWGNLFAENLDALKPLVILRQPNLKSDKAEVVFGQELKLTCKAVGMPPPKYLWYHENSPIIDQTTEELNIEITKVNQQGNYKCKIYQNNRDGSFISELFTESVSVTMMATAVVIEEQPQPTLYVKEGEKLSLSCKANSHPLPRFQWYRDNTKLEKQTSQILCINTFNSRDEGKYYCHVFNDVSEAYSQKSYVMVDLPRQKAVAKIALLIANQDYQHQTKLTTPKADVARIAHSLEEIGFIVICLLNQTLVEMRKAISVFSEALLEGVYGLFYFGGHGFKMQESYMLPIDAPEVYLRNDAICESQLLSVIMKNDPALFVTILDVCQTVPSKEVNPVIHKEVPSVNEYKGGKNLRNLIQAYSTSSHRPSYERSGKECGVYAKHLSKFIDRDIPINKVFEEVGKSVDTWVKGTARNQIPMVSSTITKPFRLTDSILSGKPPKAVRNINGMIEFPEKIVNISFEQCEIKGSVLVSRFTAPYLNVVKIRLLNAEDYAVNFYNSVPSERNDLYQNPNKKECWIHSPQLSKGPLVICLLKNGVPVGATLFDVMDFIPAFLHRLK